jgi:hypothetical protein
MKYFCKNIAFFDILNYQSSELDLKNGYQMQIFCLFILLERAEMEIRFALANGMFKMKMDIDGHGPSQTYAQQL